MSLFVWCPRWGDASPGLSVKFVVCNVLVSTTCEAVKLLFDCPELSDTRVWNVQPLFLNFKNFLLDTAGINRARIMSDFSIEPESPGPARVSNSLRNSREMPRDALGLGGYPTVRFQPPIRHPSSPPSAR